MNKLTDNELIALDSSATFTFDVECYPNLFYVAFKLKGSDKFSDFELTETAQLDMNKLMWVLNRFKIVGFNSFGYDIPIIQYALMGALLSEIKEASNDIISGMNPYAFAKKYRIPDNNYNHIDIMNVAPLDGSLKLYTARLHCHTIQSLPYPDNKVLTLDEINNVKLYCQNDLINTELLYKKLEKEIDLRSKLSIEMGIDLRSKSDAQIAEAVIKRRYAKLNGGIPKFNIGIPEKVQYNVPSFIGFHTKELKQALEIIKNTKFFIKPSTGSPILPKEIKNLSVKINKGIYNITMGGLHSTEFEKSYIADNEFMLIDNDVESFYPRIILNQGLYPPHLGESFLTIFNDIVEERLTAKRNGDKTKSDGLKITINGTFGKMGNMFSFVYAPQLMIQVTLTGQLVLLMLIEALELQGIEVISANTDGVIARCHKNKYETLKRTIEKWEIHTNFKMEETRYKAIYSRDVNNYIAIKEKGNKEALYLDQILGCKTKGTFCERGSALDSVLSRNPETLVCIDAALLKITKNIPVIETIKNCKDVRRFITVRNVKGWAIKDGIKLGKVVRYYYSKTERGAIVYETSGNKVANTDGGKPLMTLPKLLPGDIDYDRYIAIANDLLFDCAFYHRDKQRGLFNEI